MAVSDPWVSEVASIVNTMVRPLVADGGRFDIERCDSSTRQVVVRASMADCDACAMSNEDLSRLLTEAVQRKDPDAQVTVVDA
jgi:Fe-S cluster biogenesis protein NfuA